MKNKETSNLTVCVCEQRVTKYLNADLNETYILFTKWKLN
jgi:hypothetical protein